MRDVMTDLVMTIIFVYSIHKFRDDYPIMAIALIISYLSALSALLYMVYNS